MKNPKTSIFEEPVLAMSLPGGIDAVPLPTERWFNTRTPGSIKRVNVRGDYVHTSALARDREVSKS